MSKRKYDYALIFRGLEGGERNLSLLGRPLGRPWVEYQIKVGENSTLLLGKQLAWEV